MEEGRVVEGKGDKKRGIGRMRTHRRRLPKVGAYGDYHPDIG